VRPAIGLRLFALGGALVAAGLTIVAAVAQPAAGLVVAAVAAFIVVGGVGVWRERIVVADNAVLLSNGMRSRRVSESAVRAVQFTCYDDIRPTVRSRNRRYGALYLVLDGGERVAVPMTTHVSMANPSRRATSIADALSKRLSLNSA